VTGDIVKALLINSSPRKKRATTGSVSSLFIKGMIEAEAEVEVLYTADLDISPCKGCFVALMQIAIQRHGVHQI
jgi:multimeric flavodoxin WrbA